MFYTALLQTGLLLMCPIIVQPNANVYSYTQENIFDDHHLVDFPVTVDNMTVANVSHSASMTHIYACSILLLILIHSMPHTVLYRYVYSKFPATVVTVKCPSDRNNCGHSYNCLTFNGRISHYTVTQCTKTVEIIQC